MSDKILFASELPPHILVEAPQLLNRTTDYNFIIASIYEEDPIYSAYCKSHIRQGTILDNGAFENGEAMPVKRYLEIYKEIKPDCLVIPDVRHDYKGTLRRASSFLKNLPSSIKRSKLMGVLQGTSFAEYEKLLQFYLKKGITLIGMPYGTIDRVTFIRNHPKIKFHVLGLPYAPELLSIRLLKNVVSMDTSLPYKLASRGLLIADHNTLTVDERSNNNLDSLGWVALKQNLDYLHRLCNRNLNAKECRRK